MSNKQFETFCRIIDYLERDDPELARIIRGLCLEGQLAPRRGKPGITFLIPKDKEFRKKLDELAHSSNPAEVDQAADMINAHIIRDIFKTPAEWKSREVANSIYPPQVVEVESVTSKEVVFKSGAKAVLDDKFISRRDNLAVWKLTSGHIPVTKDKPASLKPAAKGLKTGSYDPGDLTAQTERFKIGLAVENMYRLHCMNGATGPDPFVEAAMSLVWYIKNVRKDEALLYDKVLPLISCDKTDFYILVQPHHGGGGEYLLNNELIHEWWKSKQKLPLRKMIEEFEALLDAGKSAGVDALVYTDRQRLLDKIDEARQRLSAMTAANPRNSIAEIEKVYKELEQNNTIGGVGPVLPPGLASYYKKNPGLKMLHDELRYLAYGAFKRLEAGPLDIGGIHDLTNIIGEYLYAATADERAKTQKLLNKNTLMSMISHDNKVHEIQIFLNSTMFLFIPLTSDEADQLRMKYSIKEPDIDNMAIFNISKDLYTQHKRILDQNEDNSQILSSLLSIGFDKLEPELWEQIKSKYGG